MTGTRGSGPRAGGVIIAIGATLGAVVGALRGEPSAGLLIGVAAGVVLAILVWVADRRR